VGGRELEGVQVLQSGDEILIGGTRLRFQSTETSRG
jgi:hypothetical protein